MYSRITSKYPNLSKPESALPRMRPTELPNQPKMINPGVGQPKERGKAPPMKKRRKAISYAMGEVQALRANRDEPRIGIMKDLIGVYRKNP
jgi:hypothetical protein